MTTPVLEQPADLMQYGGGKGNTLAALWHKVQNNTARTTQHEAAEIFSPHGKEWLSAHQISSCLTLLLHTKYRHAVHQPAIGSAHKVCAVKTLEKLLHEASQSPVLPANADFTKVLVDSCSTQGPCPSIVIGDDLHFRNICINAKTNTVDFVDPFGHGFPTEIIQQVQDFFDRHDGKGKWIYKKWSHRLQTDCYNCGIWSIWILETWMQYWSQGNITETFECFCKRHAVGLTGKGLRTYYHSVIKEGCRKTANGISALAVARERSSRRMPTSEQISLSDSPHKSENAAAAIAAAAAAPATQRQVHDSLSSKKANVEFDLQQQSTTCTDIADPRNESAATECKSLQCLNNTFRPFSRTGEQWLDAAQVLKCIQYLQYTRYTHAKHLATAGITHEVGSTAQMQTLFRTAGSNAQLDSSVDTSQTLRDSLKRSGPSPVIVFSDNSHFQVVLMNAVSKMATLFDPFGSGFPAPVRDTVETFFDEDPSGGWTYRTWTQKLQTDT